MAVYHLQHAGLSWSAGQYQNLVRSQGPRKETQYLHINSVDQDEYLKAALFSEIQILQLLKSENIVKMLDVM
jgi:hypothetical protein